MIKIMIIAGSFIVKIKNSSEQETHDFLDDFLHDLSRDEAIAFIEKFSKDEIFGAMQYFAAGVKPCVTPYSDDEFSKGEWKLRMAFDSFVENKVSAEELGGDFQKVLNDNLWELYEE